MPAFENRFVQFLKKAPLFVVVAPLFFLLHNVNYYYGLINLDGLWGAVLLYLFSPLLILAILRVIFGSWVKAAVLLFFLLSFFYAFQPIHDGLKSSLGWGGRYAVLMPVLLIFIVLLSYYLRKSVSTFQRFLLTVNTIFFVLLLIECSTLVYKSLMHRESGNMLAKPPALKEGFKCDTCIKPDIYYLLFDEYSNAETLASEFGYNNFQLNDYLKEKGFFSIPGSKSNYNITSLSLASILNLGYLDNRNLKEKVQLKLYEQGAYTVAQNVFTDFLYSQGYTIKNFSIFPIKRVPSPLIPFPPGIQHEMLWGETFFYQAKKDIGWSVQMWFGDSSLSRGSILQMEDDVTRINETRRYVFTAARDQTTSPRFIYAHFLNVHGPFYFDSLGRRLPVLHTALAADNRNDYIGNIIHANRSFIIPIIDTILYYSKRPTVIVLQGDHGFTENPPEKKDLVFENLNEIFFSDKDYSLLNDSLSSVNTFRIVMNKYFNQKLELLKDSVFFIQKDLPRK